MKINEAFEKITSEMGLTYIFDDIARINLRADNAPSYPALLRQFPEIWNEDENYKTHYRIYRNLLLFFVDKCPLDFSTPKDAAPIADNMMDLWFRFRGRLVALGFNPEQVGGIDVVDKLDVNLAGISVNIRLKEIIACI
ncbi:MAG: hypothetical protein FWF53_06770 [Candidatus Azobacteroides sp.]|nr:hypothetical protein [Candidatus Azobacteroides sp.]